MLATEVELKVSPALLLTMQNFLYMNLHLGGELHDTNLKQVSSTEQKLHPTRRRAVVILNIFMLACIPGASSNNISYHSNPSPNFQGQDQMVRTADSSLEKLVRKGRKQKNTKILLQVSRE